ncbi:translation initiation factor IF-2-like [Parus major]|uniref:translation initiation factor IF-2-like n=1 Tax=Parus major TaxID=9157 RepID=UPI000771612E|nr:translation initiation factor IF-2-like [Parus major]
MDSTRADTTRQGLCPQAHEVPAVPETPALPQRCPSPRQRGAPPDRINESLGEGQTPSTHQSRDMCGSAHPGGTSRGRSASTAPAPVAAGPLPAFQPAAAAWCHSQHQPAVAVLARWPEASARQQPPEQGRNAASAPGGPPAGTPGTPAHPAPQPPGSASSAGGGRGSDSRHTKRRDRSGGSQPPQPRRLPRGPPAARTAVTPAGQRDPGPGGGCQGHLLGSGRLPGPAFVPGLPHCAARRGRGPLTAPRFCLRRRDPGTHPGRPRPAPPRRRGLPFVRLGSGTVTPGTPTRDRCLSLARGGGWVGTALRPRDAPGGWSQHLGPPAPPWLGVSLPRSHRPSPRPG